MQQLAQKVFLALFLVLTPYMASAQELRSTPVAFSVEPQPLYKALNLWATQAGVQLVWENASAAEQISPRVIGKFVPSEALRMLLRGSGLEYTVAEDGRTVEIRPIRHVGIQPIAMNGTAHFGGQEALAQNTGSSGGGEESTQAPRRAGPALSAKESPEILSEVIVTGTRLRVAGEGAQPVKQYDREAIERSGQTDVANFLNTLSEVSVQTSPYGFRTIAGAATVQLHGLPVGTTLVLINGRRTGSSSAQSTVATDFFDLNSIPISAVERIEVVSAGSSAVYGSDAVAGVVNIVLRTNVDGVELDANYGTADGTDQQSAGFALGHEWSRGSLSVLGSYSAQDELQGSERDITSSPDFRRFGGFDRRNNFSCSAANIFAVDNTTPLPGLGSATFASVPIGFTGTPTQSAYAATAGTLNLCGTVPSLSFLPESERLGLFVYGNFQLTPTIELFTEQMYSDLASSTFLTPPRVSTFDNYIVAAANPYNPFGVPVRVSGALTSAGRVENHLSGDFFRSLIGARGEWGDSWSWEIAGWASMDRASFEIRNNLNATAFRAALNSTDPNTALNPFIDGPGGSSTLLQSLVSTTGFRRKSEQRVINGFVRGSLFQLPAGTLDVVVGAEYSDDELHAIAPTTSTYDRSRSAAFAEARVPLLGNEEHEVLAVTLAGRYDHDEFFGGEATPQFGVEWRPFRPLLVRGTYGRSFKAPAISALYVPQTQFPNTVSDPMNGGSQVAITEVTGGNPELEPETGESHTAGILYSSERFSGLTMSATHWGVTVEGNMQGFPAQTIVNFESLFAGRVTRNAAGSITHVDTRTTNFGEIDVRGVDYQLRALLPSRVGDWQPFLNATQTYHYTVAFLPGVPPTNRLRPSTSDFNWAPRWKGNVGAGWTYQWLSGQVAGRYVGEYRDYAPLPNGEYKTLGNFWLYDLNLRVSFAGNDDSAVASWRRDSYFEVGGVNILDSMPQYSANFGNNGFNGTQADLRGRFVYARVGIKW